MPIDMQSSVKRCLFDLITHAELSSDYTSWSGKWWRLVEEYTKCNFTYISDKWNAIEGLASVVASNMRVRTRSGLWEADIANELLWTVANQGASRLTIGAPSWSWLSIDGPVTRIQHDLGGPNSTWLEIYDVEDENGISTPGKLKVRASGCRIISQYPNQMLKNNMSVYGYAYRPSLEGGKAATTLLWWPDTLLDHDWETWGVQVVGHVTQSAFVCRGLVVVPMDTKRNQWRRVGTYSAQRVEQLEPTFSVGGSTMEYTLV